MEQIPANLPILPIRNAVLFPSVSMPLVVGRPRSLQALEAAESRSQLLLIVAQRIITPGDPEIKDLYNIGTLCKAESSTVTEVGSRQIVVTGIARYRIAEYTRDPKGFILGSGEVVLDVHSPDSARNEALFNSLKNMSREILELLPGATEALVKLIDRVDDSAYLTHIAAAYLNLSLAQKQQLLETAEVETRMDTLLEVMHKEREVLNIQKEIREKMSERINKAQREALLREQMRTIRTELGEEASEETHDDLEEKLVNAQLPEEAGKQAQEELRRLRALPSASAEYHVIRTYLEWLVSMPWKISTKDSLDLIRARKILDEDHYGLEKVKRRILQFLAVAKLKNDIKGPILCLIGPPGVGKTSLGQSIARTLDRKFIRTSLGGIRDEAEIRGHRRTYVGAMPGRIIQSIRRIGTNNPLMLLDEIDKLRADFHGDPSAAMLEVLDPEQNTTFVDHYLDVPFDLSNVFFVATGNVVDTIPTALKDRMEIIEVSGYTNLEKLHIAQKYLVPRELKNHGLLPEQIMLPIESIMRIISHHTREAGVRELQRQLAALFRVVAEEVVKGTEMPIRLFPERLRDLLGTERFFPELAERTMKPGIATGLAWTPHGGDILFIEASRMPGRGNLTLTGQLGDVMKESAQIALSLARSATSGLLKKDFDFNNHDIHIHVPAGAIPKDGPSAGVAILTALASLLMGRAVDPKLGLTGEITLRGAVLPVGGIKEKILAAHRAGLRRIVLPRRNEQDLKEVPEDVLKDLRMVFVENVDEVLAYNFNVTSSQVLAAGVAGTEAAA